MLGIYDASGITGAARGFQTLETEIATGNTKSRKKSFQCGLDIATEMIFCQVDV